MTQRSGLFLCAHSRLEIFGEKMCYDWLNLELQNCDQITMV